MKELLEDKYVIFDRPVKVTWKYCAKKTAYIAASLWYKVLLTVVHPNYRQKKYSISICSIFRDEALYLREWIEFHRIVGVQHFYLYNNFSEDNYMEILKPYIESGEVTLTDWPYKQAQMEAYADCVAKYGDETNWIGFIDIDEFVIPNKNDLILDTLDDFRNRPAVVFQWRYFGSSGIINRDTDGLVTEDFYVCWNKYADIGKLFFNTGYDYWSESKQYMHSRWAKYKGIKLPSVNIFDEPIILGFNKIGSGKLDIQVNHYVVKSFVEYVEKKSKRGGVFTQICMT